MYLLGILCFTIAKVVLNSVFYRAIYIFFQSVSPMVMTTELSILKAKSEYWVPGLAKPLITQTLFSHGRNGKKIIHF